MATQEPKAFIRSMPRATPAEIVEAAAKVGVPVTVGYVQRLRIIDHARAASAAARKGKPKASSTRAAKKAVPKGAKTSGPVAKSAKVTAKLLGRPSPKKETLLAIGLDKPTRDIIDAAQAKGVSVSSKYVRLLKIGLSSGSAKLKKHPSSKLTSTKITKVAAPAKAAPSRQPGRPAKAANTTAGVPKRGPGRPPKGSSTASAASTSSAGLSGLERTFISAVVDLGLARAQQLLDGLRVTLRAIAEG